MSDKNSSAESMQESTTAVGFSSRSMTWKLHSYEDAIERHLASEVDRVNGRAAFLVTSKSIAEKTSTLFRAQQALGTRVAGVFTSIENDSTFSSVEAATAEARKAGADLIVAIGGGSVIVAARAVNIFLCEEASPFELMTQYPEGGRAYSPRLDAPKLPIINVVTTPTSAMNRAGTGLKNEDLDHRMEYFDPKTRPIALLWDWQALNETPLTIIRSTATTTFSGCLNGMLWPEPNPLVEGDRVQAFRLASRAFHALPDAGSDPSPRVDLCAAAFLANRAEDDAAGSPLVRGGPSFLGDYAVSTALHLGFPNVGQGEATSVLSATVVRRATDVPFEVPARAAVSLGVWREGMDADAARHAVADELERAYRAAGMPIRVRELGFPRDRLPWLASLTVKNFNANRGERSESEQQARALQLLEDAW